MGAIASHPDNHDVGERRDGHTPRDAQPLDIVQSSTLSACAANDTSLERFPTKEITWNFGGQSVYVTGAWDNWAARVALNRLTTTDFSIYLTLPPGTYQYKYIVDGSWKHNPANPTQRDENGNLNNMITIRNEKPDFDSNVGPHEGDPGSPIASYDFSILPQEDHAAEPPTLPRMLASVPLDRFSRPSAMTMDFVRLGHIFETDCSAIYDGNQIRTMATEVRHKSKLITTILVIPKTKSSSNASFSRNRSSTHGSISSAGESHSLILDALNNV